MYKIKSGKKVRKGIANFRFKKNAKKKVKVLQRKKKRTGNVTPFNPRVAKKDCRR